MRDYGIKTSVKDSHTEYLRINNLITNNPNTAFTEGMRSKNLQLIKKAVENGADPNHKETSISLFPIMSAARFNDPSIFYYLSEKALLEKPLTREETNSILKDYVRLFTMNFSNQTKCQLAKKFFGVILPSLENNLIGRRHIWNTSLDRFKYFYAINCFTKEFYDEWIDYYTNKADN